MLSSVAARTSVAVCAWLALAAGVQAADAVKYPTKPIRMLVPAPPGGTTDLLARIVGAKLSENWNSQVVVDNRGGAGGVVAADILAKSDADGHTLMMAYTAHTVNAALHPKLPYRVIDDFQAVTQVTQAGLMLVVTPTLPVKSVKELIAYGKANPGKLSFSSAGNGSGGHVAGELFKMMTGVQAQHIPYKGTGPSLIDLMAGHIPMSFAGLLPVQPHVKAGKVRALAVTSLERIRSFPDIPTVSEAGIPGFEVVGWYGVLAPRAIPKPVLDKLHGEIVKIVRVKDIEDRLTFEGSVVVASTPAEFTKFLRADLAKWQKVLGGTKAQVD